MLEKLRDPNLDYFYEYFVVVDHVYNVMGQFSTVTECIRYRKDMKQAGFITKNWKIFTDRELKYILKSVQKGESLIKETVCNYCNYRYRYRTEQSESFCPICGAHNYTRDLEPVKPISRYEEDY